MNISTTILLLIVVLAINSFAAKEFKKIASYKGYDDDKYFWWSFLAGPIGFLMVVALPNKKGETTIINNSRDSVKTNNNNASNDELPEL